MSGYSEADLEQDVLEVLAELGWEAREGKQIAPGSGERESWAELIIPRRLKDAVTRINPDLPEAAGEEVVDLLLSPQSQDVKAENLRIHEFLTRGLRGVSYVDEFGAERFPTVHLIDRSDPELPPVLRTPDLRSPLIIRKDVRHARTTPSRVPAPRGRAGAPG